MRPKSFEMAGSKMKRYLRKINVAMVCRMGGRNRTEVRRLSGDLGVGGDEGLV